LAGIVSLESPPGGFQKVYAQVTKAAADTSPDAVILATPHDTHVPLALEILDLGLPLLCEKPVGRSADEARQVLAAGRSASVPVGVVLNQRALVHHRWIRNLIVAGELAPRSITFSGNLARLSGWHADAERVGGGLLRVIGLHYLDLLRWWLGESQTLGAVIGGGASEDRVNVTLTFGGGATGRLELTAQHDHSIGPVSCIVEADNARIRLNGHRVTHQEGLPQAPAPEEDDSALIFGPGHQAVINEASAALAAGRGFPVTLADALPSLALVDRAYACANQDASGE